MRRLVYSDLNKMMNDVFKVEYLCSECFEYFRNYRERSSVVREEKDAYYQGLLDEACAIISKVHEAFENHETTWIFFSMFEGVVYPVMNYGDWSDCAAESYENDEDGIEEFVENMKLCEDAYIDQWNKIVNEILNKGLHVNANDPRNPVDHSIDDKFANLEEATFDSMIIDDVE